MENETGKLTVLFGSGADTDALPCLCSGQSFSEALIKEEDKEKIVKLLGKEFQAVKFLYPSSTKIFIQTVVNHQKEATEVLTKEDIENCVNYAKGVNNVSFENVIRPLCSKWYKNIVENDNEDSGKIKAFFLKNAVLCDSLDEKFNSLRFTDYNLNAKRAISAYTQVFLLMVQKLYTVQEDFEWTFDSLYKLLGTPQPMAPEDSYYGILRKSGMPCNVITTNYTDLVKCAADQVTYLHGNIKWFEDLEKLTVFDCTNEGEQGLLKKSKRIVPFILIPSGVKPLICTKQIKEFGKFIDALETCRILLVIGYKFNSEDNHINSIVADWLRKPGTKLIYFNYNGDLYFDDVNWIDEPVMSIEYEKGNLQITESKVIDIKVDRLNSRVAFNECINLLKEGANDGSFEV